MKVTDRCTGHCCEQFTLPVSPEELEANYRRWLTDGEPMGMNCHTPKTCFQDIHLIYPMVVYLGYEDRNIPRVNPTEPGRWHWYTCKHFDPKSRDCTIYDIRPQMCRSYPSSCGCNYAECTWEEVKQKPGGPYEIDGSEEIRKACPACGASLYSLNSHLCDNCNTLVCSNCWSDFYQRCDNCTEKGEATELKATPTIIEVVCADCGAFTPVTNAYRCMCDATVCMDCWDPATKKCAKCIKECKPTEAPKTRPVFQTCGKCKVNICEACKTEYPRLQTYLCVRCGAKVCPECGDGDGLCKRCEDLPEPETAPPQVKCSICGTKVATSTTYNCECGKVVCDACWIDTECVKCAATKINPNTTTCAICRAPVEVLKTYRCGGCGALVCAGCWVKDHCLACANLKGILS